MSTYINEFNVCMSCEEKVKIDHNGIRCVQDHVICKDCSKMYINLIFSEPHYHMPSPKCPECKECILLETIEIQLKNNDLDRFHNLIMLFDNLNDDSNNEKIYFNSMQYNNDSQTVEVKFDEDDDSSVINDIYLMISDYSDSEYEVDTFTPNSVYFHNDKDDRFKGMSKSDYELCCKIGRALEDGSSVHCPKCGLAGRKDESCTHIVCCKCKVRFCYVCGLSEEKCNKKLKRRRNIYDHNTNWKKNKLRCPMYLHAIYYVDSRWPSTNETECLNFFHRLKTLRHLKELFSRENIDDIKRIENTHQILSKAGYSISEILDANTEFICRKQRKSKHCTII